MVLDTYATSYGKALNIENAKKALLKYITEFSDLNLSYEYSLENIKLVVITGYSQDEKDLPIFEHPIVIKDIKGRTVLCVDIRKYVKVHTEQALYLKEIIKDISTLDFIMVRTIVTSDFINGKYGSLANIEKNLASGYAMFLSGILSFVANLTPVEKIDVEIILAYFFLNQFIDPKDREDMEMSIQAKVLKSTLSMPTNLKIVQHALSVYKLNTNTLEDVLEIIKLIINEDKKELVNLSIIYNNISSMWYGPGGSEAMLMSLEHVPTWTALMYSACVDKTFKRSRLAMVLDKVSNKIKVNDIEKFFDLYLKEHTL